MILKRSLLPREARPAVTDSADGDADPTPACPVGKPRSRGATGRPARWAIDAGILDIDCER